jgi:hypothetical protein
MARAGASQQDVLKQRAEYEDYRNKVLAALKVQIQARNTKITEWDRLNLLLRLAILKTTDRVIYNTLPRDSIATQV